MTDFKKYLKRLELYSGIKSKKVSIQYLEEQLVWLRKGYIYSRDSKYELMKVFSEDLKRRFIRKDKKRLAKLKDDLVWDSEELAKLLFGYEL